MEPDDAWIRALWPRVYGVAFRMLGNATDAQDAAQEAFVRALAAWEDWLGDGPREHWLLRITTRCSLDALAARKRRGQPLDPECHPAPERPDPEPLRDRLLACLENLPPQQRAAFVLREIEQLPFPEVAEALGCSAVTARVHLMKAKAGLKVTWLRKFGEAPL